MDPKEDPTPRTEEEIQKDKENERKLAELAEALTSKDPEKLKPFLIDTPPKSSSGDGGESKRPVNDVAQKLKEMRLEEALRAFQNLSPDKTIHKFWDTQPVPKLEEKEEEIKEKPGPLESAEPDKVRMAPLSLPKGYEWYEVDIWSDEELLPIYNLLRDNYVEDDDSMFRFDYSMDFLRWALSPPGNLKYWHVGVRVATSKKPVGFITAIPATICILEKPVDLVEINFLCVHKKLRSKRLAPVLISEITRRVHVKGRWQAVYTAGAVLPRPVSVGNYYHRNLNPKKLLDVHFTSLGPRNTLSRAEKLFRLPTSPTHNVRPLEKKDIPAVTALLKEDLAKTKFYPQMDGEEVSHWLTPRSDVVDAFVLENPETHEVTDFFSFYHLPSTVLNNPHHSSLHVTYLFYTVATSMPLKDLMYDALIMAKKGGADVFNALDIGNNPSFLKEHHFGKGDGALNFYLYNYRCQRLDPSDVSLILM